MAATPVFWGLVALWIVGFVLAASGNAIASWDDIKKSYNNAQDKNKQPEVVIENELVNSNSKPAIQTSEHTISSPATIQ